MAPAIQVTTGAGAGRRRDASNSSLPGAGPAVSYASCSSRASSGTTMTPGASCVAVAGTADVTLADAALGAATVIVGCSGAGGG